MVGVGQQLLQLLLVNQHVDWVFIPRIWAVAGAVLVSEVFRCYVVVDIVLLSRGRFTAF